MQGGTEGNFVESEVKFPETRSWEVRLGDMNKDNKLDIIVTNDWERGEDTTSTQVQNKISTDRDKVKVYPNPSSGNFSICLESSKKMQKANTDIYNSQGKQVFSEAFRYTANI
jgi:hypothetical protein